MAQRNLKARYQTVGPKNENVSYRKYRVDENGALQFDEMTEEMECYYVFFPHGHSIRVTSRERLIELGYHIKPRLVDMDTGDVVDIGGDPYDFASDFDLGNNANIVLAEEEELGSSRKRKAADATA